MVSVNRLEYSELEEKLNSYHEIRKWREEHMEKACRNSLTLNEFHDQLIKKTTCLAMKRVESELGPAPARFAFFMMGSGGRAEQSVWSDQDHGIIFDGDDRHQAYFLQLGVEITNGLHEVGYEYCDGKVMSSHPRWCKSIKGWQQQISEWLEEASWETLRHFSTFFDSRVLIGKEQFLMELKTFSFQILRENPFLYIRLLENVCRVEKGIGVFGQFLPKTTGKSTGSIDMKNVIFFPYVNSLRLLALVEEIVEPSTLGRFQALSAKYANIKQYSYFFERMLALRLSYKRHAKSYEDVHYLYVQSLNKEDKQEIKKIMKNGYKLFSEVKDLIRKRCSS